MSHDLSKDEENCVIFYNESENDLVCIIVCQDERKHVIKSDTTKVGYKCYFTL